ncbi:hypothetical protein ACSQ67_019610 [Phaseolus vulgaris]
MGGNGKHRWKISFHRSSSQSSKMDPKLPPKEFTCPISGSLMSDPVVVASGQTFERLAVQVCKDLNFSPKQEDGTRPDFSTVIPNLALRTTILNWCDKLNTQHPRPPDFASLQRHVTQAMAVSGEQNRQEEQQQRIRVSEKESVIIPHSPGTPLPFTIRPTCFSSSSSSCEIEIENPSAPVTEEEEGVLKKLKSSEVFEQEEGVIALRRMTRSKEESRSLLCTPRVLLALRGLIASRYGVVQVNAVASLVNLSLEKQNKEHAAGALFSLALDDDNKMAIGVLGALQPLMHALRAESERTRHDSALALYHLSLVQSNRVKLVKLGAVPTLLSMVVAGNLASRVLLILCNLAVCTEGRTTMLDANAVECLVGLLRANELDSEATRENCVAALFALSHRSLRFKGLAKDARVVEVLKKVEQTGTERAREKARKVLHMLRTLGDGDDDEGDDFYDSAGLTRNRYRLGAARNHNIVNTTTF